MCSRSMWDPVRRELERHVDGPISGWVAVGRIRGWCGHAHRTVAAAERCAARDQRGCAWVGGYSDRVVAWWDARARELRWDRWPDLDGRRRHS